MKDQKLYTVYAIRCKENGRIYVGCTKNLESRIKSHFSELLRGEKSKNIGSSMREDYQWQKDFNEYGRNAFQCFILESHILEENKRTREDYWVSFYHSTDPEYGYNIKHPIPTKLDLLFEPGLPPLHPTLRKAGDSA